MCRATSASVRNLGLALGRRTGWLPRFEYLAVGMAISCSGAPVGQGPLLPSETADLPRLAISLALLIIAVWLAE